MEDPWKRKEGGHNKHAATSKFWLKGIQGLHTKHKNHNHINSFDDDGLKRSCVKYKDSEWTPHGGCTYVTYNKAMNGGFQTLVAINVI